MVGNPQQFHLLCFGFCGDELTLCKRRKSVEKCQDLPQVYGLGSKAMGKAVRPQALLSELHGGCLC